MAPCTCRSNSEIERGSGFVEQDEVRVLEQRARNRNALPLAPGELGSVLAGRRVVSAGKRHDEIVRVGRARRVDDLGFARTCAPHGNIFADRAAKQEHILPDIGNLAAQGAARHRCDILAVDDDAAAVRLMEAQQQIEDRGLAAAGGTDKRGNPSRLGNERQVPDDPLSRPVGELNLCEDLS